MTTVEMVKSDPPAEAAEPKIATQPTVSEAESETASPEAVQIVEPTEATSIIDGTPDEHPVDSETKADTADMADTAQDAEEKPKDESTSARPEHPTHSQSYGPTTPSAAKEETASLHKTNSTSELTAAAAADDAATTLAAPIRRLPSSLSSSSIEDQDISTIPDPRLRAIRLASGAKDADPEDEITALSTKLIDAINHQSTLDDTLSRTRMELEESREQVRKLEELSARQKEFLAGGLWVRKSAVEAEKALIIAKSRDEKRLRLEAEAAKAKIELELETLTAELFEQANIMVAAAKEEARAEQLAANRRYDNLKGQLADTEVLLKSQQEQLTQLKQVMEEMIQNEAAAGDDHTTALTTPTSPGFGQFDFKDSDAQSTPENAEKAEKTAEDEPASAEDAETKTDDASSTAPVSTATEATVAPTTVVVSPTIVPPAVTAASTSQSPDTLPLSPSQPMSFTHLLRPVLRYDTAAFHEFVDLIRTAQIQLMLHQQNSPQTHGRSPSSTSLPKTPPMSTNSSWNGQTLTTTTNTTTTHNHMQTSAVTMSAVNAFATVTSGLSVSSNASSPQNHTKELKEAKFYKRVVVEDIEPTLRLDTAPGISWLVRRNIMSAVLEGTLVAEPVPNMTGTALLIQQPCSMCGESRRQDSFLRHHRFRLTESDKSTPYPLCNYCLSRVRSVCGFLVFLRMIKEGHWRASDEEAEQAAWEECVRLREHMFWARIGGGVLPAIGLGNSASATNGVGSARHSRVASAHNSISSPSHRHHHTNSGSTRPSIELGRRPSANGEGTPTKLSINSSGSPVSSPLASPAMNMNNTAAGLGIENTNDRPKSSSSPNPSYQPPNRPSKLSSSVAAMVSGMGGHL
ncbi:rab guanine nucleotide exchange factor S2 [Sporothrix bragantina]|uniref:Rab guanine nucleotide exchange factor S2 n=1 Tax=Sporothrix bragantina TaxID=671064 RepID=A0ABP0BTS4_9PEZI